MKKKLGGPKVLGSELLKQSAHMSSLRRKMFSENRERVPSRTERADVYFGQKERSRSPDVCEVSNSMQLLTFYPRQSPDDEINEFLESSP